MKRVYDKRVKEVRFQIGDFVWLYSPRNRPGRGRKWQLKSTGPHLLVGRLNAVNYIVRLVVGGHKEAIVHVDRLRSYTGDILERWREEKERFYATERRKAAEKSSAHEAMDVAEPWLKEETELNTHTTGPTVVNNSEENIDIVNNDTDLRAVQDLDKRILRERESIKKP